MSKVLSIDLDKEYRLKIESATEIQDSFFKDIYKQAFEQVENIVRWSKMSFKPDLNGNDTFSREIREYNNIIAFTGERGTGKSSAMLTVANNLASNNESGIDLKLLDKKLYKYDTRFESLHTIDPSKFEKHQNIIEVILAELFESFNALITDKTKQYNEFDKREVLKAFQEVYKCLKVVSNTDPAKKFDGDALETLATLADATKLEKNLQELISKYLKFIHPTKAEKSSTLIIPIDDFDLNVKSAGDMAEQIRKYLMIPQVVVLMAINLEQFGDVKTQEVLEDFKTLLDHSKVSDYPRDIASRYILKLIPIERRLSIPTIKIERNNLELFLFRGDSIIIEKNSVNSFEKQIFDYIYIHTGLFFVYKKEEYHTFLPDTIRELKTLFSVLGTFESVFQFENINDDDDENTKLKKENFNKQQIDLKAKNLIVFEKYFFNTWIKDYLLIPFQKMIFESSSIQYSAWNKYFITSTVEILSKEGYNIDWKIGVLQQEIDRRVNRVQQSYELETIINRQNYASNISLGDLIFFYSYLNRLYINDKEIKRLFFSINCLYSIKLNTLNFDSQYNGIVDIVNGTVINQYQEVIRERETTSGIPINERNRIQFRIELDDKYNIDNKFLTQNIFIKHDVNYPKYRRYREHEDFVNKSVYDDNFPRPTFNLFSFVYKDHNNIFPIPYNNLELWYTIIESIDKDFKGKSNEIVLVSFLFKQILSIINEYEGIVNAGMKQAFLSHSVIKLFLNENDEFLYEKYEEDMNIPEWFQEVYSNNKAKTSITNDLNKIKTECKDFIVSSSKQKATVLNDAFIVKLKGYNLPRTFYDFYEIEVSKLNLNELKAVELKPYLFDIIDKIFK